MSNLFLTNTDMAALVTSGAETTRHKLNGSAGAASTLRNKNGATGPTVPLKVTDSTVAGTDGATIAWYSEQLQAVTIAGQIVASLWGRENATTNNAAPALGVYRCSDVGAELATIVDPAGVQTVTSAPEFATTAGGAAKTVTIAAADVVDTGILLGERLKVALFIEDAVDQGGSGSMSSSAQCQFWVNGPDGVAGQSKIAFTETILSVVPTIVGTIKPVVAGRPTNPGREAPVIL
jgi:hypothetical protein